MTAGGFERKKGLHQEHSIEFGFSPIMEGPASFTS